MSLVDDLRWVRKVVQDALDIIQVTGVDPALRLRILHYHIRNNERSLAVVGMEVPQLLDVSYGSYESEMDIVRIRLEALEDSLIEILKQFGERTV